MYVSREPLYVINNRPFKQKSRVRLLEAGRDQKRRTPSKTLTLRLKPSKHAQLKSIQTPIVRLGYTCGTKLKANRIRHVYRWHTNSYCHFNS